MHKLSPNALGATVMMISMAGFVLNDALVKLVLTDIGVFQSIVVRGIFACSLMAILCWKTGAFDNSGRAWQAAKHPMVIWRSICETFGAFFFLTALSHMPIANVTAVFQILPLTITLGAALFFGEKVGWRRYLAILVGLFGVMLIIQPGTDKFDSAAVYALVATVFITIRDLTTRGVPHEIPSLLVGLVTALAIMAMGLIGSAFQPWLPIDGVQIAILAAAAIMLMVGNVASVITMRHGDVSFVAPFRYSILIWALLLGYFLFDDVPDTLAMLGAIIVVGSGLFSFYRERALERTALHKI